MSAKKTSGPSKPRSTSTAKRGRPAASRSTAKVPSQTDSETTAQPEVAAVNAKGTTPAPRKRATKTTTAKAAPSAKTAKASATEVKPSRRTTRKATTVAEPDVPVVAEAPAPKRGRPRKTADQTVSAVEPTPAEAPAKRTRTTSKARTAKVEAETSAETPVRRRGRPRKADAAPEASAAAPKPARRQKATPKVAESQDPSAETPAVTQTPSAPLDSTPKARRPRRAKTADFPAAVSEAPVEPSVAEAPVPTTAQPEASKQAIPLFSELGLAEPIMSAIRDMGYERPTPIQAQAIPQVIAGHDVLGVAQTGTGKTASFTLPMLEKLAGGRARARMPRSLILEPTRELALQVAENFKLYGKNLRLNHALLIGGESMVEQREVLNRGVDVLIATPGRLLDLFNRGGLLLTQTSTLVIDEADRMLDMGFIPDIERIVALLPPHRQTLFFSATMAPEIRKLADAFLRSPVEITVSRPSSVATTIEEALLVVEPDDKKRTLRRLLRADNVQNAIVFCNRKRDVDMLQHSLTRHGMAAGHLHGDLAQSLRTSTLDRFRSGDLKILVCSDVAARGIDISGLSHVFNYDLPFNAEDYVHRIGRTGRAGNEGHAFSLATPREKHLLDAIEALTGKTIPTPAMPGINTVPWASEKTDAQPSSAQVSPSPESEDAASSDREEHKRRKRRRGGKKRRDETRDEQISADATIRRDEPSSPAPQTRARDERPVVELAPAFEDGAKTGFGSDTPAFMLLPRRKKVTVDVAESDLSRPVQHDAKHYGEH